VTNFLAWIVGLYAPDDEHPIDNEGYVLDLPGTDAGDPDRDAVLADALRPCWPASPPSGSAPPAHHTPTVSASNPPATGTPTTVGRTATPTAHRQMPVASASSEFGFEG
jgi:hypothetical protein